MPKLLYATAEERREGRLAAQRRYREKNREALREKNREYAVRQREDPTLRAAQAERSRRYREANPERWRDIQRRSYLANAEKRREEAHVYRTQNRERVRAWLSDYYERTRDERLAYARRYRRENRALCLARTSAWFRANPERRRVYDNAYRARKANAEGSFTPADFAALCEQHDHRCFYCGRVEDLTADHVVALSRGGSNAIENIVPACRPCNSAKRDRDLEEFLEGEWLRLRVA